MKTYSRRYQLPGHLLTISLGRTLRRLRLGKGEHFETLELIVDDVSTSRMLSSRVVLWFDPTQREIDRTIGSRIGGVSIRVK